MRLIDRGGGERVGDGGGEGRGGGAEFGQTCPHC